MEASGGIELKMGFVSTTVESICSAIYTTCNLSITPKRPFLLLQYPQSLQYQSLSNLASPLLHYSRRKGSWNLRKSITENIKGKVSCSLLKVEDGINDDEACELVNGIEVYLGEDGADSIRAYLYKAVKNNNGTGILLLSDIFGFEDSFTRDFAYRVACNGYNVLVPDLFCGDPWTKDKPKAMFEHWIARHSPHKVSKDISISSQWMVNEFMAAGISKKLGIIGFCYGGGRVIEVLARDKGAYFGTGVSFYGTRMDPSLASDIKVPVLFISGDDDPLCDVTGLKNVEQTIGRESKVVVFPGRGHGFAHRPQSPEEDMDAEEAFMIMRNWMHQNLAYEHATPV